MVNNVALKGWHFSSLRDGYPVLRDGSPLRIGESLEYTGTLRMCTAGYHDSERITGALRYALGTYLTRVEVSADLVDADKRCSRHRRAIAGADIQDVLVEWARRVAYCALLSEREAGREPDPRSWAAVKSPEAEAKAGATYAARAVTDAARAAAHAARAATYAARAAARDEAEDSARAAASAKEVAAHAAFAATYAANAAVRAKEVAHAMAMVWCENLLLSMLPEELRL